MSWYGIDVSTGLKIKIPTEHINSWIPSEWKERNLILDSKKKKIDSEKVIKAIQRYAKETLESPFKSFRLEYLNLTEKDDLEKYLLKKYEKSPNKPLKVITTPPLRVGATKDLCPNLEKLSEQEGNDFIKAIVEWHTYAHRRNSIAGGGIDEDGEPTKGFLSFVREDGRVSTPADTLGASTFRMQHREIANIPRTTSLYGETMRELFGCGEGYAQLGFDFSSLENRIQGHYIEPFEGGPELGVALLAEKPNDIHCYSEDTEILTINGWKIFGELSLKDKVAQYHQKEKEITFVNPLEIVWQSYNGKMIHFKNKSTDMLLTPNHRFLYRFLNSKEFIIKEAKDVSKLTSQLQYPTSSSLISNNQNEHSKEFYELLIATQADGHLTKDSNAIQFSFTKQRKIDRLLNIVNTLNIDYSIYTTERKNRIETTITLKAKDPVTLLLRKYLSETKEILLNMIELSYGNRYHILNSVKFWGGTVKNNGDIVIDTTDEKLIDKLQELCSITNAKSIKKSYNKKVKDSFCLVYRLYYSLDKNEAEKSIKNCSSEIDYNGMIGCVSVPTGLILVRRNGKPFISGNTINANKLNISRNDAKSITYALLYGAAPAKLKKMLGLDDEGAEKMYKAFWDSVPPLRDLRDKLTNYWESVDRDHIPGIDGRKIRVRSQHSLIE